MQQASGCSHTSTHPDLGCSRPLLTYLASHHDDGAEFVYQYAVACCVAQLRAYLLKSVDQAHHTLHGALRQAS